MGKQRRPPNRPDMPVEMVPYEQITVDHNCRLFFGDIENLAQQIEASGWVSPLIVKKHENGSNKPTFTIIAGERRYRAVGILRDRDKENGYEPRFEFLKAELYEGSELGADLLNGHENLQRQDLRVYELAKYCLYIKEKYNLSGEDVAKKLSLSKSYVNNCIRVMKNLHPDILKLIESKGLDIPAKFLFNWIKLPPDVQLEEFEKWKTPIREIGESDTTEVVPSRKRMKTWRQAEALLLSLKKAKANRQAIESVRYLMGLRQRPPTGVKLLDPNKPEPEEM